MKKPLVLLLLLVALTAGYIAARATGASPEPLTKSSPTLYDRVIQSGTVRCGYTPYSAGFRKDPNTGEMSGIYYDIVTKLAENLNLNIEWVEEVSWAGQIEGLQTHRFDMICSPVSLTSSRARSADFSIPLYSSPVHIWARTWKDMPAWAASVASGDVKALNNPSIRISTLDGEQTSVFAKQFFLLAQQVSLPQSAPFSDLLMQVTDGKADIVFAEPFAVDEFAKNNSSPLLMMVTPVSKPLLIVPNVLLMPRDEYAFKEMIDNGLREMFNSRVIDMIIDKYETYPNSYIRETASH